MAAVLADHDLLVIVVGESCVVPNGARAEMVIHLTIVRQCVDINHNRVNIVDRT